MTTGMDLSSPIASGRTAEVYAVPGDQVLKLLKPGFDPQMLIVESAKTAAVRAAGGPAPGVKGLVEVGGRPGLLFERISGTSMLEVMLSDQDGAVGHAVAFADLHGDVLSSSVGGDLPDVKEYLADKIDHADLPLAQRTLVKDHMVGLPEGDATLHGDFHPGNILLAPDGPIAIDWGESSRGAAAADVARTLLLLTPESAEDVIQIPEGFAALVLEFARVYKKRCLERTATTIAEIEAWRLPVAAARISEGLPEQTKLLQVEVARLTS